MAAVIDDGSSERRKIAGGVEESIFNPSGRLMVACISPLRPHGFLESVSRARDPAPQKRGLRQGSVDVQSEHIRLAGAFAHRYDTEHGQRKLAFIDTNTGRFEPFDPAG